MNYNILILIILIIISLCIFFVDINSQITKKCLRKNKDIKFKILVLTILHHFLQIFANFGWLFNNKIILIIYVTLPIILLIHWENNKQKCKLTQIFNEICNLKDNRKFNDIYYYLGFKKYDIFNNYLHHIYLLIVILIAFYKLFYK